MSPTGTVILAGLVNLAIAAAKFVGGMISHSSAMLSEAAHSVADTVTEVLLFVALKRGTKPPDRRHPFGYGRETYFWAFLASLATFVAGAGFSIYQGIHTIVSGETEGRRWSPTSSWRCPSSWRARRCSRRCAGPGLGRRWRTTPGST